jgi:type I restriction enzyme R subunit
VSIWTSRTWRPYGDGFVNWRTTHLVNAVGGAAVMLTRARIVRHQGVDVCRLDVGRSPRPVKAKTSKEPDVFYVRMNNSSRVLPEDEIASYVEQRFSLAS